MASQKSRVPRWCGRPGREGDGREEAERDDRTGRRGSPSRRAPAAAGQRLATRVAAVRLSVPRPTDVSPAAPPAPPRSPPTTSSTPTSPVSSPSAWRRSVRPPEPAHSTARHQRRLQRGHEGRGPGQHADDPPRGRRRGGSRLGEDPDRALSREEAGAVPTSGPQRPTRTAARPPRRSATGGSSPPVRTGRRGWRRRSPSSRGRPVRWGRNGSCLDITIPVCILAVSFGRRR